MDVSVYGGDFEPVPGLFKARDFGMLLEEGRSYLIEDGGRTDDGQALYLVFRRPAEAGVGNHG